MYWGLLEEKTVKFDDKYPSLHSTKGRKINLEFLFIFVMILLYKFGETILLTQTSTALPFLVPLVFFWYFLSVLIF